jgi:hypothetical protein
MEQATQALGSLGTATESLSAGVASAKASGALAQTAWGLSLNVSVEADLDAKKLIGYLAGKIGGPIPAEVATFLEAALATT